MKAEIGFAPDAETYQPTERMQLVITAQSTTERSALQVFARRCGLRVDELSSTLTINESPKETPTP